MDQLALTIKVVLAVGPKAIESVNGGSATGAGSIPGHMAPLNAKDYTVTASGSLLGLWVAGQHAALTQAIFHTEIHNQDKDLDKCGNKACDHDV